MTSQLLKILEKKRSTGKKGYFALLDPDYFRDKAIEPFLRNLAQFPPDALLVGGSHMSVNLTQEVVLLCQELMDLPVYLFPGSSQQVVSGADGILFTSLISGRNPEYLIGQQVAGAPLVREYGLEVLPTGYLLIESGRETSVSYVSNTKPIPRDKPDLTLATALAGQYLGLRCIYLEAGSGAKQHVPLETIEKVSQHCALPLVVGGGIRDLETASAILDAGADCIVVGTRLEQDPAFALELQQVALAYK